MTTARITIKTPKPQSFIFKGSDGAQVSCRIKFSGGAGADWTETMQRTQAVLDTEVMRTLEPYMPLDTGMMVKSMISSTHAGDGEIKVNTPYAARVNYVTGVMGRNGGLRGRRFFDRMKADKLAYLKAFLYKATGVFVK